MRLTCTSTASRARSTALWEGESLLYVLRERLQLPGSKNACEQGECGSCSVYLDGVLVCSCLVAAGQAEGRDGGDRRRARRRGRAAPDPGGVPRGGRGAVRVLHAGADRRHARPAGAQRRRRRDAEIREALAGNLCRCTGYEKILDAVRLAASR